jgi:DNA helicase-2/ATP-dependent DNA helicase PcrA
VGITRARSQLVVTGAARRRVFGEYQAMEPSRFMDELPPQLVERIEPAYRGSSYQGSFTGFSGRANAYGRGAGGYSTYHRPGRTRDEPTYSYEDEDQSTPLVGLKLGAKVRHPQFGIGTVLSLEDLADDLKLVVRFSVGPKTLRAKYAKLELV